MRIAAFLLIGIILCAGCQHEVAKEPVVVDTLAFRNGDLLFREGPSIESRTVMTMSNGQFSHVGILLKQHDQWCVVHAVPGETENGRDTVKCEPINEFLRGDRCLSATIRRIDCNDSIADAAAHYALTKVGVEFDNDYELTDTTRYYCTELLWQAYLHQHLNIITTPHKRHNPHKYYLLPQDLLPQ